jgi:hypothetical protein
VSGVAKDGPLVAGEQLRECRFIAVARPAKQLGVVHVIRIPLIP